MAEGKRDQMITIRLSLEEYDMVNAVAKHEGLTLSDWIRQSFRKAYRRIFGGKGVHRG